MGVTPQRRYSLDDYFAVEVGSSIRHEFLNGEIFAMAGASVAHNDIAANVLSLLRAGLGDSGCRAFGSDLRLVTPGGLYTYPDVMVICGRPELVPGRPDTVTNPVMLVEVLSPATRDYDRGEKRLASQTIPTLRELLLVEQDAVAVERLARDSAGTWRRAERYDDLGATVPAGIVPVALPLAEIYREVFAAGG